MPSLLCGPQMVAATVVIIIIERYYFIQDMLQQKITPQISATQNRCISHTTVQWFTFNK